MSGNTKPLQPAEVLDGVTVVEVSTRVSGAYCGHLLQTLGAKVMRADLAIEADIEPSRFGALAASLHHGKSTLALADVASAVMHADVLVVDVDADEETTEQARTASHMARRAAAQSTSTSVVDLADFESVIDASGVTHVRRTPLTSSALSGMAWAIGTPDREPLALPYDLPDYLAGTEAAAAACVSLLEPAGAKARYELSTTSVVANYVGQICSNFVPYGRPWHRSGPSASMSGGSYPAAMFACMDGHVSIMCRTNREWLAVLAAMGEPEWAQQEHFRDAQRVARHHADEADVHMRAWVGAHTRDEMLALSDEFRFPVAPILTTAEALAEPDVVDPAKLTPIPGEAGLIFGAPWAFHEPDHAVPAIPPGCRRNTSELDGRPLTGLRVLDLSWVWAGPMVTGILSDLGADVIKVEGRARPDPSRIRGRALVAGKPADGPDLETSAYFSQLNSGKRSVAIDFTTPEGRELVKDLAKQVDVVVENMRPGVLQRHGLDFATLSADNPGLVMLSMSIFGHGSPLSRVGGYAPVMSGYSGLDAVVGYDADDLIGLFNPALGDPIGAGHAVTGLLAALYRRNRTGVGAWIDVSQVEALLSVLRRNALEPTNSNREVPANKHSVWWPHGIFRAGGEDDWVAVAIRGDLQRERVDELLSGTGTPALSGSLDHRLSQWVGGRSSAEAVAQLARCGIDAAKVASFEELRADHWHERRGIVSTVAQNYLPEQAVFHTSWTRDDATFPRMGRAPMLGQHTVEVLSDLLGHDNDRLQELKNLGAIDFPSEPVSSNVGEHLSD